VVVVGAGVAGLSTAAALARAGFDVQVLEAHVYPGGCAGTFYYQGYRFDAGATLAGGFYPGGPMDLVGRAAGVDRWPARPARSAMTVHLPDGTSIERLGTQDRWERREAAFGSGSTAFWEWQERTADALWDLALSLPPWPPQSPAQALRLATTAGSWMAKDPRRHLQPQIGLDAFRTVSSRLNGAAENLRLFVDAQLLISAQTTSRSANALFGAAALDLPRRGVVHLAGGMGAIAETLVAAVERHGGQVRYRQEVTTIRTEAGRAVGVKTKRGGYFPADYVVGNLPPWNLASLLDQPVSTRLNKIPPMPDDGWGAFMVYVGLDDQVVPPGFQLHHQVVSGRPLAEGNSIFMSLSPEWDMNRAPLGRRSLTISTHTRLSQWWELYHQDREAFEAAKQDYAGRMLQSAEKVLPGLRSASDLILPGTPLAFKRFTRRAQGWVGGFPQTSLFRGWGPQLSPGLWMVGDSIFPGQSTPAVAMGGLRVADEIARRHGSSLIQSLPAVPDGENGKATPSPDHQYLGGQNGRNEKPSRTEPAGRPPYGIKPSEQDQAASWKEPRS
jgi:C-3',4' desaturase CrtD